MPIEPHEAFTPPADDTVLWRYLTFVKFMALLETNALWMARLDTLADPFEGSIPRWLVGRWHRPDTGEQGWMREDAISSYAEVVRSGREAIFVNCWYAAAYDSAAMWTSYGSQQDGVAVRTTVGQLRRTTAASEPALFLGRVAYLNYERSEDPAVTLPPLANMFEWSLLKRTAFAHEHEVRLATMDGPSDDSRGFALPVDLVELVDIVTVAPFADPWFVELVAACCSRYELSARVERSDIGRTPNYRLADEAEFRRQRD